VKTSIQSNAALATKYKLRMKAYESGPHNSTSYFPPEHVDAMTALFSAAHRNPRMRDVYMEYLGTWKAAGGDTMNQYFDVGAWSKWGLWGALETVTQDRRPLPSTEGCSTSSPPTPESSVRHAGCHSVFIPAGSRASPTRSRPRRR
jgi:hypothetical protein